MQVRPFAFDRVFTVATPEAVNVEALRLQVEQLQHDLASQKLEIEAQLMRARAEGFQAALDQVRGERQAALLAATDAIHAAIEALDARFHEAELKVARAGGEIALAAADYLAARALELEPAVAIDAAIGRALRQVRRGQPITIRVHPDLVADMETLVADRQAQDRRRLALTVIGDEGLPVGDARLAWDDGGLALDAGARRELVARELDELYPPA